MLLKYCLSEFIKSQITILYVNKKINPKTKICIELKNYNKELKCNRMLLYNIENNKIHFKLYNESEFNKDNKCFYILEFKINEIKLFIIWIYSILLFNKLLPPFFKRDEFLLNLPKYYKKHFKSKTDELYTNFSNVTKIIKNNQNVYTNF